MHVAIMPQTMPAISPFSDLMAEGTLSPRLRFDCWCE
jgi:hypothetical protein